MDLKPCMPYQLLGPYWPIAASIFEYSLAAGSLFKWRPDIMNDGSTNHPVAPADVEMS